MATDAATTADGRRGARLKKLLLPRQKVSMDSCPEIEAAVMERGLQKNAYSGYTERKRMGLLMYLAGVSLYSTLFAND